MALKLTLTDESGEIYTVCTLGSTDPEIYGPLQVLMDVVVTDDDGDETTLDEILHDAAVWHNARTK